MTGSDPGRDRPALHHRGWKGHRFAGGRQQRSGEYEAVTRPNKKERDFVEAIQKQYLKHHIAAILGLQIILTAFTTTSGLRSFALTDVNRASENQDSDSDPMRFHYL